MVTSSQLIELSTRYGIMFAFAKDDVITRSLRLYGEWAEHEIYIISSLVKSNTFVLDIGANIGTHSVALSARNPSCTVWGFEPRPTVSAVAQVNVMRNLRGNVKILQMACGKTNGFVELKSVSESESNIGEYSIADYTVRQRVVNPVPRMVPCQQDDDKEWQSVPVVKLDSISFSKPISLIKIDVEGSEHDVIVGAQKTLKIHRPIIFLEATNIEQTKRIAKVLDRLDFRCHLVKTHPFNQNNFNNHTENVWYRLETALLAVHRSDERVIHFPSLDEGQHGVRTLEDPRTGIAVPTWSA